MYAYDFLSVERNVKPGLHLNENTAHKNKVIVLPSKPRQIAFGYTTNVRRTAKHYLSTVGTSKGSRIQYVYVWSIRCIGECRTVYRMYRMFYLASLLHALFAFAFRCKPSLRVFSSRTQPFIALLSPHLLLCTIILIGAGAWNQFSRFFEFFHLRIFDYGISVFSIFSQFCSFFFFQIGALKKNLTREIIPLFLSLSLELL